MARSQSSEQMLSTFTKRFQYQKQKMNANSQKNFNLAFVKR